MAKYKEGDIVKVWSLQSFTGGGFLNGTEGIVKQDQTGDSVLVSVARTFNGKKRVDPAYEVYEKQLELVHRPKRVPANLRELILKLKSM
jgi:hypothetical protein